MTKSVFNPLVERLEYFAGDTSTRLNGLRCPLGIETHRSHYSGTSLRGRRAEGASEEQADEQLGEMRLQSLSGLFEHGNGEFVMRS